jgi:hypothetical protein
LQITRYPSLSEQQFLGCLAAFVDALNGELNGVMGSLRRLEGRRKGAAFAYEIELDKRRYGAILTLDRWAELVRAYGAHADYRRELFAEGPGRVKSSEEVLGRANQVLDACETYAADVIAGVGLAVDSIMRTFSDERAAAEQTLTLGPMLPAEFHDARRVFGADLAAR